MRLPIPPPTFCQLHSLVVKTVSLFSPSMQEKGHQSARRVELDEPTAAVIIQRAWRSFNVTAISILFVLKGSEQPYFHLGMGSKH